MDKFAERQAEFNKRAEAANGKCVACFRVLTASISTDWRCGGCYVEDRQSALAQDAAVPRAQKIAELPPLAVGKLMAEQMAEQAPAPAPAAVTRPHDLAVAAQMLARSLLVVKLKQAGDKLKDNPGEVIDIAVIEQLVTLVEHIDTMVVLAQGIPGAKP